MTRDTPARPIFLAVLCCAVICSIAIAPAVAAGSTPAASVVTAEGGGQDSIAETARDTPTTTGDVTVSATAATNTTDTTAATNTTDATAATNTTDATAADTDDRDTAAQTGGWSQATYTDPAGDIVTLTLSLSGANETAAADAPDHAYVQIGSAEAGFIDVLYLDDANDDGEVTVAINTRTLGTSDSISATSTDLVYHAPDDEVRSAVHGRLPSGSDAPAPTFLGADGEELSGFDAYIAQLGLIGSVDTDRGIDQLDRPVQPGTYPVAAGTDGTFRILEAGSSSPGEPAPGTSAMVAATGAGSDAGSATDAGSTTDAGSATDADPATLGRSTIELTRPGIGDISVHAAPAADANAAANSTALQTAMTERDAVAAGDRLVIAAEATGIYGHLVAIEGDFESLETGVAPDTLVGLETRTGEGVRFAVEAEDGPVVQGPGSSAGIDSPTEVLALAGADPETAAIYTDEETGELYVVVDTRDLRAFDPGETDGERAFSASMAYETDREDPFLFDREDRHIETFDRGLVGGAGGDPGRPAFPYLDPGTNASAQTGFTTVTPRVRFAGTIDPTDPSDPATGDATGPATDSATPRLRLTADETVRVPIETNLAPGTELTIRLASREAASLSYIQLATARVGVDGAATGTFDLSDASIGDTADVTVLGPDRTPIATATAEVADTRTPTEEPQPISAYDSSLTTDDGGFTDGQTPGFGVVITIVAIVIAAVSALVGRPHRKQE